ncbi:hypothetical protein [Flavobacterium sp.]|uniref:hypothetical protein n=1 Tax=Flavobacterium sp. TaxID=239 RepID=UPI0025C01C87|nr:hypothetical protein [Flavobacterium sp.]MBA4276609.1 hypothetical protein [Flavobacterium sp.]
MIKKIVSIIISSFLIMSCSDKNKANSKLNSYKAISDTTAVFIWTTELCENTGTYNPKKYSNEQLKNTYDLWFTFSGIALETNSNAHFIEDINELSVSKLTSEYVAKKEYYNREIISSPFWNKIKQLRLQDLEDEYELKKITIEAYTKPSVLLNNRFSKYCNEYAQVLSSNDSIVLLNAWKNLVEKQKSKNGAPEKFMEKYYKKYNSKERLMYAKIELMTYGWWNCGNSTINRLNDDGTMEKEFNKIFSSIKTECDEL